MKIILGDGMYTIRSAGIYQKTTINRIKDQLTDLVFDLQMAADQDAVDSRMTSFYTRMQSMLREIIPVTEVHYTYTPGDNKPYGCPGFIYFQTAISELQRYAADEIIMLTLDQNDGRDDWLIFALVAPRNVGYSLDSDIFGGDPTVIVDYLIFQPSPDGPGMDTAAYLVKSNVQSIGIRLPKFPKS